MIRRIAIGSQGGIEIPKAFSSILSKDSRHWRVVLAELIDSLKDTHKEITQEVCYNFRNTTCIVNWYIKSNNCFYFKNIGDRYNIVHKIKIVEVDTSRKWNILDNGRFESIIYYEEPMLIDKELNMYSW